MRQLIYVLFALSGLAGLIYESVWTQYLRMLLGHAAYAQALVLVLFMGGMALGAWLAGDVSRRLRRPLLWYAAIEGVLAVAALAFDPVFRFVHDLALDVVFPAVGVPWRIELVKWALGSALILPQCVLLGATFPMISAGIVRSDPARTGRALAWLYFSNSLGACIGVLASGFVLIAAVGLPGTLLTAGLVNALLAVAVWQLQRHPVLRVTQPVAPDPAGPCVRRPPQVLLWAAAITGAASFCYEIGWIRMLSLVLGSATHSFELMLAAFILGLALGSLLIRRHLDALRDPLRTLGWIQLAMALLALLSLPLYVLSFDWMQVTMDVLPRTDAGYAAFTLVSQGICIALMLPVTVCAGMTLPLVTRALLRHSGEAAVGRVYAANTLGSIAGVLLAVHVLMPWLGLREVVVAGAALDFALGVFLLWPAMSGTRSVRIAVAGALALAGLVVLRVPFEPLLLSSGVYRDTEPHPDTEILFHEDGKTATITVARLPEDFVFVSTNGKTEASLSHREVTSDDHTQVLLAGIPLALHADPRAIAIIGFGSGRTTHVALADPRVQRVDTIEIEPQMYAGARAFGSLVERAFHDPRSHVAFEDARSYFARHQSRYDIIISEPSNPWVSGIAGLFSREFYARQRRTLNPGGLMAQWVQLYEINLPLVASIAKAVEAEFGNYDLYLTHQSDLLILAAADGRPPAAGEADWSALDPALTALLDHVDVRQAGDLRLRYLGSRLQLAPFFANFGVPPNSEFHPYLDQHAVRERFLKSSALALGDLAAVVPRLTHAGPFGAPVSESRATTAGLLRWGARSLLEYARWSMHRTDARPEFPVNLINAKAAMLLSVRYFCDDRFAEGEWLMAFREWAWEFAPYLSTQETIEWLELLQTRDCDTPLPVVVQAWFGLVASSMIGDLTGVHAFAGRIEAAWPAGVPLPRVLVRESLLAWIRAGDVAAAQAALRRWSGRMPDHIEVDYLRSLIPEE